jgi:hypothetical protein
MGLLDVRINVGMCITCVFYSHDKVAFNVNCAHNMINQNIKMLTHFACGSDAINLT